MMMLLDMYRIEADPGYANHPPDTQMSKNNCQGSMQTQLKQTRYYYEA